MVDLKVRGSWPSLSSKLRLNKKGRKKLAI
jgi:hypothetical protein